ncbi:refilin-B-like [Salvelinus alpinus]|uniref:Refilin-B-like n=1 Tax=Salvelinus namaycush TaxID=8040 RepID=A0A8U0P4B7_SALNM|nr:refilin-B-like [Salvelinus alpinus]XP_038817900.1 refilin-B-like [Salvelinus namaycush]XP_055736953.1 refilin-B-like [Salvelinus fontinalis]
MVGRLNLLNVCDDDPLDMSCKAERGLDSPDSGLPPSPSPSHWLLPDCRDKGAISPVSEDESRGSSLVPILSIGSVPRLHTLSYGEGIVLDPLLTKEIRYTSSVHYDSERHFIHDMAMQPRGLGLENCSQMVLAVPHSTWRHYKTQLDFQPRQRAQRFQSTTIVYPKHARTIYTTELSYDSRRLARRFMSRVELEAADRSRLPQ